MSNVTDQEFFNVTIKYLSVSTLRTISMLLNPVKFIPTKDNLPRDWRGLADLTGCNCEEVSMINCSCDPTLNVLKRWCEKDGSLIKLLLLYLQKLDRFDVYDDIIFSVISDINNHTSARQNNVDTSLFITLKDHELYQKGLPPKQYDACILYADEDGEFAAEIVNVLEKQYNLDIFMKERDLIGGTIEHDVTMKMIANRSNRLIVILSPAFLESSENKYFISFAQSIGIDQRQRKIIPCIYKDCDIPYQLKSLHKLNYNRSGILCNFFEKLYSSVISAHSLTVRAIESTPSIAPVISTNTLTVPNASTISLKEHSSLPDLSENVHDQEKDVDAISRSSLQFEKQNNNKKSKITSFLRKKILKKKPKALEAS